MTDPRIVLAGDVGGTTTRLGVFEAGRREPLRVARFPSREHAGLDEMVRAFLEEDRPPGLVAAAFGVAGPVAGGRSETVNLAWPVDEASLRRAIGIERVRLLNDLEANAWGLGALRPQDLETLQAGAPDAAGNLAVISPGTGLGQAGLAWDGHRHHVFATEGGHADFAPADPLQDELLAFLRAEVGHVSWERVCSGMGLVNCYRFLGARAGGPAEPGIDPSPSSDAAAERIGEAAEAGTDPRAVEALDLMIAILGAQAGNLALTVMATGGVYVGGGIAPKVLPRLRDGGFLGAFTAKGRFAPLLRRIPVRVILNDLAALMGAARAASALR